MPTPTTKPAWVTYKVSLRAEDAAVFAEYRQKAMNHGTAADAMVELALIGAAAVKEDATLLLARRRAYVEASKAVREKLALALRAAADELIGGGRPSVKAEAYVP